MNFSELGLSPRTLEAVTAAGYSTPTPIQAEAIPPALQRRDVMGLAQTGSGKTAAFVLPMLSLLEKGRARARMPRTLILEPTRELADQVREAFETLGKMHNLSVALLIGGVAFEPQALKIDRGADVVIATPGRLLDHFERGKLLLTGIDMLVIDEADRMLDMGFAPDVRRVVAHLPPQRQSLLFSATMPDDIRDLANRLLKNPVVVEVARVGTTVETVEQRVCFVERSKKHHLLLHLLQQHQDDKVLVFARTKHGADRIARNLGRDGVRADAIHGNKGQGARQRALRNFSDGTVPVLVATDIASRGIDVKEIGLVVNFDLPEEPEAYVHRIGRTARAGASGLAISFCDGEERSLLRDIQRLIRQQIPVDQEHPFAASGASGAPVDLPAPRRAEQGSARHQAQRFPSQHRAAAGHSRSPQAGRRGSHQGRPAGAAAASADGAHAPAHAPQSGHHHTGGRPQGSFFTALRGRLFGRSSRG